MGVIAQFTENITLDKVKVAPDLETARLVSVNADATHFVGCSGTLLVENCTFMNQLDDSINVHGNYLRVHKVISSNRVIAEIPHKQQVGVYGISEGNALGICNADTMLTESVVQVEKIHVINKKYFDILLKSDFPFQENQEYCLEHHEAYPEVIFRNNYSGKNRARSLLLSGAKRIIIENNVIESEGAIVKISADMTGWYESGRTTDILIRNNKLSRRNETKWGKALFDIDPEMTKHEENRYFHQKIVIESNEIQLNSLPFAFGQGISDLSIENNIFYCDSPDLEDDNLKFQLNDCGQIKVQGNTYKNKEEFL